MSEVYPKIQVGDRAASRKGRNVQRTESKGRTGRRKKRTKKKQADARGGGRRELRSWSIGGAYLFPKFILIFLTTV